MKKLVLIAGLMAAAALAHDHGDDCDDCNKGGTPTPTAVAPEPGTLLMLGTGLIGICLVAVRRRRNKLG